MSIRALLAGLIALSFCLAAPLTGAQTKNRVKLVLFNGKIFTADARGTIAQAVAVQGERIVAVGTDAEVRGNYAGDKKIDLHGQLVTPGFNDAHIHFLNGGRALLVVDLSGTRSIKEVQDRIAAKVRLVAPGTWITGRGWDHTVWGGQWPTRQDLDTVAPNNPVAVVRLDGHILWVNSLAIRLAGVTRNSNAPVGGEMLRDGAGEPTGIFKETAQNLIAGAVPNPTPAELTQYLDRALQEARRYGITSIQDNSGYETTKLYADLLRQGKLTVRVAEWQAFDDPIPEIKRQRAEFAGLKIDPFHIRLTSLKGYVDGTLGSRTAAMLEPFSDDPHNSGIPRKTPEELTRMIVERDAAGFQICLHAIGDRANRMALDGFEAAAKNRTAQNPPFEFVQEVEIKTGSYGAEYGRSVDPILPVSRRDRTGVKRPAQPKNQPATVAAKSPQPVADSAIYLKGPRHRIEHAQVVAPSDFARFRDLGVIASMQPSHAISDKRWAQDRLGEYRVQGAYAWNMMRSFNVHVPFGTDWPVESIDPYLGLYAAVTRESTDGLPTGGWWPQERITIDDAIRCYTAESAYAEFEENDKGRIAPGMLADFVVHSRDLLTIKPADILQTHAVLTILGGDVIYDAAAKTR